MSWSVERRAANCGQRVKKKVGRRAVIKSACLICGITIPAGTSRCATHDGQPLRAMSSCVKCGRPALAAFCDAHVPKRDESKRADYRKGYRDPTYHRERAATLRDAKGVCSVCGVRPDRLEVDHIVPLRDGGSNKRYNLRAVCVGCHRVKTREDRRGRNF